MWRAGMIAGAMLLVGTALPAQQWSIDAQAGRIRSALDPNAPEAESVVLGIRYDDLLTGFRLSGGVPTSAEQPLWGAVSGGRRMIARFGGFFGGVDVAGNAFLMHDRVERTREIPGRGVFDPPTIERLPSSSGSAFAAQGLPILGFENAAVQAYARAGVSYYSSSFGEQKRERTVQLADAQLTYSMTPSFALMPSVRHYRADEGNFTHAGATALASIGPTTVWGSVGQMSGASDATTWAAGVSLRVHDRATISGSVREDAIDPLYLTPAQRAWNAGISLRVGSSGIRAAPIPARYENGRATIRLAASQARTEPRIAGDFTDWKPMPMQRSGDHWTYTAPLKPGVYNYAFVDERGEWFVPEKQAGRKDDGMGGHVAVLVVQ